MNIMLTWLKISLLIIGMALLDLIRIYAGFTQTMVR